MGWFEEPLPADDVAGHERLAASTTVPADEGGLLQQLTKRLVESALKGEVTELVEAADEKQSNKTIAPQRAGLACSDELGGLPNQATSPGVLASLICSRRAAAKLRSMVAAGSANGAGQSVEDQIHAAVARVQPWVEGTE
ncbi:hypothetical protein [Streptomyces sp. NPDC058695]|uniref:hypothetical protein n=1 Tax=Streptomyces sp. NPDC058695 TaxID=3346604 RepID=UPI003663AC3B